MAIAEPKSNAPSFRAVSTIMGAIMGSRVLGLVREMVLNAFFGAGKELDAFYTAFRIPNLLRDLFAEGALSTSFVTVFSKKLTAENKEHAMRLANVIVSIFSVVLTLIVAAGIYWSEEIVIYLAPGFIAIPGKIELTIELTQILFPFIAFVSLAAVFMGLLNSLGSFGLPASASTAFNATSIIFGIAFGYWFDPNFGPRAIYGFAIGTVIGGIIQWAILLPKSYKFGYRMRWVADWKDTGFHEVLKLMIPAVIGSAAIQINVLVNTFFASFFQDGAVTYLNNAFRLMQLPIGMFGVAIGMVTLPAVAKSMATVDKEKFASQIESGLRLVFFLSIPATVGLWIFSEPIVSVLYERGQFTYDDTLNTALMLQGYLIGLTAYGATKVVGPAFYALDEPFIPLKVSIIGIGLNVVLILFFTRVLKMGMVSLPVVTAMVAIINFLQLVFYMKSKVKTLNLMSLFQGLFLCFLASVVMGLGIFLGKEMFWNPQMGLILKLLFLAVGITFGGILYFGMAYLLRLKEWEWIGGALKRRLSKNS
jgi:putative peptidoglycan lipid II flippase